MIDRLFDFLKRESKSSFFRNDGGNVAVMFAMLLPVLLASIGTAIDYSRVASARTSMQGAADATALMISKEATNLSAAQITSKAQAYFTALYTTPGTTGVTVATVYTANSGSGASVKIDAAGSMATEFMKLVGYPTMNLNVSSTTKWGNIRYRVALALDNTGSMASAGKITELKTAATKLVNDFYTMAAVDADIYISIVPFSKDTNVGTANKAASWLRWTEWDVANGTCSQSSRKTKAACVSAGKVWTPASHNTWEGCVMDRDPSNDIGVTAASTGTNATLFPAEQYKDPQDATSPARGCPVAILGMTSVKSQKQTLLDKITAMTPVGTTNQTIGLAWAWLTHATSGPFTGPTKDINYVYQDVIILLTDGLNTENRWDSACVYSSGVLSYCGHETEVDVRQALLCTAAKTAGMKIFAIQVATDNDDVSTVTKNCTSYPDNPVYFSYLTQASQMTLKFDAILKELSKLRISS